ncbi:DUF2207 domain-containing protein [Nocardioides sp. CN2-186]|uniref:DUF2207 domain-containing protein n=1 Tax=Nocardioides tweenelious TaxID=3156607 RepID=UPI0032B45C21
MKRLVVTVVSLIVVILLLLAPGLVSDTSGSTTDSDFTISSYKAVMDVDDNGDLSVDEVLKIDFVVSGKHGIFRFWDRSDPSASHARRNPHDVTVTMDGQEVPVALSHEDSGRYLVAKVGDPDRTLTPGVHTYNIHYEIDGILEPGTNGHETQFYWNLVPDGPEIAKANVVVNLPVEAQDVQCAQGAGAASGCTATGEGTKTLQVQTGPLAPHTPVTVKAGLDMPTPPPGDELPWTAKWDPVFGTNVFLLALVLLLSLGAAVLGYVLARRTWERAPQFPLMYTPPEGVGPAQAAYIVNEKVDDEQYVATLMYAAEHGAIDLANQDKTWTITDKNGAAGWAGLDPVTSGVAHLLGGPGTSFTASPKDVEAGKRLKSEIDSFESSTTSWASSEGLMTSSGLGGLGSLVIIGCFIAVLAFSFLNPLNMSAIGLIPGAFAIAGGSLAARGAGTKRTKAGRDLWSKAGGFKRILSTSSAEERFDFSGRKELYTAYIPWAVAFGCADEWAEKYRLETASEPPVPSYLGGYYGGAYAGTAISSMVDDFHSTVSSAVSSYEATQKSSSGGGGGGGFSGGGGGGGGGVGSW